MPDSLTHQQKESLRGIRSAFESASTALGAMEAGDLQAMGEFLQAVREMNGEIAVWYHRHRGDAK